MELQPPRSETSSTTPSIVAGECLKDRRRPGRSPSVSPNLIDVLRRPTEVQIVEAPQKQRQSSDLDAAIGIAMSVVFSAAVWVLCGGLVWLILG